MVFVSFGAGSRASGSSFQRAWNPLIFRDYSVRDTTEELSFCGEIQHNFALTCIRCFTTSAGTRSMLAAKPAAAAAPRCATME